MDPVTLPRYAAALQRTRERSDPELPVLLVDVAHACRRIARAVTAAALHGLAGDAGTGNVHGETQKKLDVAANELLLATPEFAHHAAGIASEELEQVVPLPRRGSRGRYLLVFDPLDGSSNIDVNISVGTIFSILRCPEGVDHPTEADFLQPGTAQVAAGYALYGPSTMLVLTLGDGADGFTLDPDSGEFVLTHPGMSIPCVTREFAINASNERFWEPPVKRYVEECLAGAAGPRGANFNMRWIASLVAEVHRILIRGGVFLYPRDNRDRGNPGRLRLLYEANPMAFIVEQAGGAASTGEGRLLEAAPTALHQRVPVILGSRSEVERIERYYAEAHEGREPFSSPLFRTRSLFLAPTT